MYKLSKDNRFMEHVMKVFERIINAKLTAILKVSEKQYDFMKGR